ncbi:MAG: OmpH family outer membrane protein [Gammaproteobacteria bacterium]
MKKSLSVLLMVGVASFGWLPTAVSAAELRIGFVNAAKVLEEAPQAKEARDRLEKEFAPRDKELVSQQQELKKMEEKLARDGAILSETEQRKLEREILNTKREIKRAQDEFREDFNIRRNEEFGKLQRRVYEAIVALAKQEKYDVIISDGVLFASERVDMTDKVLERLRSEAKREASGKK